MNDNMQYNSEIVKALSEAHSIGLEKAKKQEKERIEKELLKLRKKAINMNSVNALLFIDIFFKILQGRKWELK